MSVCVSVFSRPISSSGISLGDRSVGPTAAGNAARQCGMRCAMKAEEEEEEEEKGVRTLPIG